MAQTNLLTYIYGTIVGVVLFLFVRYLYSVYYTPGVRSLYNSPVTQQLFPNAMNKIYPLWGYNQAGMYDDQPFKFGADRFYPESGPGYKPSKYGSGGASPEGGMRPTLPIPKEVEVGWWSHSPQPVQSVQVPVYGSETIPEPKKIEVGWWNN
jgi:hypothetical protein